MGKKRDEKLDSVPEAIKKRDQQEIDRLKKIKVFRSLAQYMKGSWRFVFLAWFFVAMEVVCEVLVPFFSRFLIGIIDPSAGEMASAGVDKVADYIQLNVSNLWIYAALMVGMALVSAATGIMAGFFAAKASAKFGHNLRQAMYYRIQEYSFANIDKFSTPSLVTRLTTDVTNVQNSVQMVLRTIVRAPMMMIFALIMSAITSWQLSLVFLAVIPFLAAVLFGVAIKVHPTFVKVFNAYDDLNASVQENLQGIRVVKSFGREQFENEKFGRVSYFIYRTFIKAERILAFNGPAMQLSVYASMLVISWFGAKIIVSSNNAGTFTTGEITSLFTYVMQILNSLMFVSMSFVMIIIARNSAERITEVLQEVPSLTSPENAITEIENGAVDFEHVCFRYDNAASKNVLDDINVHIPSGSMVGIIGATGSSKTSFVNLIARLYDVNEGSVKVGGRDVREYDLASLRDAVAVVLQKNVLFTGTIRSNLLWGNENATEEQMKHAAHLACADEFIERFPQGYDSPIDQGGTNVSGGQRQRLCIARALLKNPKVLILDDSTSAVDAHTDSLIRNAFQNEIPNVTKFIVAQRILSIKDCDIILVLEDGKIVAAGNNETLMKTCQIYKEIYQTQLGGGDFDA